MLDGWNRMQFYEDCAFVQCSNSETTKEEEKEVWRVLSTQKFFCESMMLRRALRSAPLLRRVPLSVPRCVVVSLDLALRATVQPKSASFVTPDLLA